LFNEELYHPNKWTIDIPLNGYASTSTLFCYGLEHVNQLDEDDLEKVPTVQKIENFIMKIVMKMKVTNEVCLLALIFIERLMVIQFHQLFVSYNKSL
jgi:hypothetical protein